MSRRKLIDELAEPIDESAELIDESARLDDESAELIDESAELIDGSAQPPVNSGMTDGWKCRLKGSEVSRAQQFREEFLAQAKLPMPINPVTPRHEQPLREPCESDGSGARRWG